MPPSPPRVVVATSRAMLAHDPGPTHPESPSRLEAVLAALRPLPVGAALRVHEREARRDELGRLCDASHLDALLALRGLSGVLEPETPCSPGTVSSALLAAGACLDLTTAIWSDGAHPRRAFAAVRPPGHHAERGQALGYCALPNVALAAARALDLGAERVAVVDWDVHHGNGTESLLRNEPRAFFASLHERALFPEHTGDAHDDGRLLSLPLEPGTAGPEYLALFRQRVLPAVRAFAPSFVMVSCGFDAHADDPMSSLALTDHTFESLARDVRDLADDVAEGRLLMVLEGGYDLASLGRCVRLVVSALAEA